MKCHTQNRMTNQMNIKTLVHLTDQTRATAALQRWRDISHTSLFITSQQQIPLSKQDLLTITQGDPHFPQEEFKGQDSSDKIFQDHLLDHPIRDSPQTNHFNTELHSTILSITITSLGREDNGSSSTTGPSRMPIHTRGPNREVEEGTDQILVNIIRSTFQVHSNINCNSNICSTCNSNNTSNSSNCNSSNINNSSNCNKSNSRMSSEIETSLHCSRHKQLSGHPSRTPIRERLASLNQVLDKPLSRSMRQQKDQLKLLLQHLHKEIQHSDQPVLSSTPLGKT